MTDSVVFKFKFSLSSFFKKDFIYFQREGKGRRTRGRDTLMHGCLSGTPHWGHGLQPRPSPWLGIKLATLWFPGQYSIHRITPARAKFSLFLLLKSFHLLKCTFVLLNTSSETSIKVEIKYNSKYILKYEWAIK